MAANTHDQPEIAAVIEQYRRGFATVDAEALKSIWDQDYDQIIYIAQEMAQPVLGWAGVEHYYRHIGQLLEHVIVMEVSDLAVDVLGDLAYAFLNFHFEGQINNQPHIADGRVTFLLHRQRGLWKVIHYHESRPGAF